MANEIQAQCWICPKCGDDHEKLGLCTAELKTLDELMRYDCKMLNAKINEKNEPELGCHRSAWYHLNGETFDIRYSITRRRRKRKKVFMGVDKAEPGKDKTVWYVHSITPKTGIVVQGTLQKLPKALRKKLKLKLK